MIQSSEIPRDEILNQFLVKHVCQFNAPCNFFSLLMRTFFLAMNRSNKKTIKKITEKNDSRKK